MRPCDCGRARAGGLYDTGQCRLCWRWLNDPAFRRAAAGGRAAGRPPVGPPPPRPPCVHLGTPLDRLGPDGKPCLCVGKWLHGCDVHGTCTRTVGRAGVACCAGCGDYKDPASAPE